MNSTKKATKKTRKKRKKTRLSRPRKQPRMKRKIFPFFLIVFLVEFLFSFINSHLWSCDKKKGVRISGRVWGRLGRGGTKWWERSFIEMLCLSKRCSDSKPCCMGGYGGARNGVGGCMEMLTASKKTLSSNRPLPSPFVPSFVLFLMGTLGPSRRQHCYILFVCVCESPRWEFIKENKKVRKKRKKHAFEQESDQEKKEKW